VRSALLATRRRRSVLGSYGVDASGDTTIRRYGIYRVAAGALRFIQASG
jgi:branched-chain amino acid transport system substrate-binding protein